MGYGRRRTEERVKDINEGVGRVTRNRQTKNRKHLKLKTEEPWKENKRTKREAIEGRKG